MSKDLNRRTAFKLDSTFYTEYDTETNSYGVFGDSTGFCYMLSNDDDCKAKEAELNNIKTNK